MSSEEKSFWEKYKKIMIGVFVIVVCFLFAFPFIYCGYDNVSETTKDFLKIIFGAIVGGLFTLFGSLITNRNLHKSQGAIRRKDTIYKPLYEELRFIHYEILKENPYPNLIDFEERPQDELSRHPQYIVWGKIKNDTRIFEVPADLKNVMEELYAKINLYQEKHKNVTEALDKIYSDIINKMLNENKHYGNIGNLILSDVCEGTHPKYDLLKWRMKTYTVEDENHLCDEIMKKAQISDELQQFKEAKSAWNAAEEKALKLLAKRIEDVVRKYEK